MRIFKATGAMAAALMSTSLAAQVVEYEAVYVIDDICAWVSSSDPCGTPIPVDQEWTEISLGDRFIVRFSLDTSAVDTNDTNMDVTNGFINGNIREGRYAGLLSTLSITPAPGNTGTYDPSGKVFLTPASVGETLDNVATWVAPPGNLFHEEKVRVLTGVLGAAPLSGELTNVSLNFLNYPATVGAANPDDLLDDRSFSTDPFPYAALSAGPDVLTQMTDDVVNTAFSGSQPHPFRRPFTMHFGEVIDYDDFGGVDLDDLGDLHVAGTLERLRIVTATPRPQPQPVNNAVPIPTLSAFGLSIAALSLLLFGAWFSRNR